MHRPRAALLVLLVAALLPAGAAEAQQDARVGNFWVRMRTDRATGEDRSLALVFPDRVNGEGALMWACGDGAGPVPGLRLNRIRAAGGAHPVILRFDEEARDTVTLQGVKDVRTWFMEQADGERFTRRVRSASRLAITVLPDSGERVAHEYRYTLSGADSALQRLDCGADPPRRGRPAGRVTLEKAAYVPWVDERGRLTDAQSEHLPRPANMGDIQRFLARNYPVELRNRGVEGQVELRFRVLETGRVDSASVLVTRTTHPEFNPVAIQAAQRLVFEPARVYNRPVRVWVSQPFYFVSLP